MTWRHDKVLGDLRRILARAGGRQAPYALRKRRTAECGAIAVDPCAIEWRPTNKVHRRKLNWMRFDQAMRGSGRPV
jgi:hypothetical protein